MTTSNEKAKDMMGRMKADIREVMNKYATEATALARNKDKISPVLSALQLAIANAAIDYVVLCGVPPADSVQVVANITGASMQHWINTVMKLHGLNGKTTTNTLEVTNEKPVIN